jgi:hypothetical protein
MKFKWKLKIPGFLKKLKKDKSPQKINTNNRFNDALYTKHFLYPLISLYPMQLDLHWMMIFLKRADSPETFDWKFFEDLAELRPSWTIEERHFDDNPTGALKDLLIYVSSYKTLCQSGTTPEMCVNQAVCTSDPHCWCRRKTGKKEAESSNTLDTFPSTYELFEHQLQWLALLKSDAPVPANDNLEFLRNVVEETLLRLLKVRNLGIKYETDETRSQNLSLNAELVDHRINRFCDYILEEIEEICLGVSEPFTTIQVRVDNAQRYIKNGMDLLKQLEKKRQEIFVPLLANIVAFLESMDRVLHRFRADEADNQEIPEEMLFLLKLPLEKPDTQSWVQVFYEFTNQIKEKVTKECPGQFFQTPYWSYAALGPRVLGELYLATVNHSFKEFEFDKASLYFKKLRESYPPQLSIPKEISLLWNRSGKDARKLTGLKVDPANLRNAYSFNLKLPFLLKVSFGAGLLVIAELDYGLWNKNISQNAKWPFLIPVLLFIGSLAGTFSLISGSNRIKRSLRLFGRLLIAASIPSLLSCVFFENFFKITGISFPFLMFGSIFFAVVVNTIGNIRR